MAHIEISNLNSAGSDLFASDDSFLTELKTTETTQIFGGYSQRCGGRRRWKETSCPVIIVKKPIGTPCKPPVKVVCRPVPCFVPPRRAC